MNDAGVSVMTAGSAGGPPEETLAPGIKDFILGAYGVIFSTSAREAAEKMTRGTPEYREKTGRETVLRHRGANVMFGDPQEAYVVESNARNHFIRKPGDFGEKNYLVIANHFLGQASYGENGQLHQDRPMTDFEPGRPGSHSRYWTGYWWAKNNEGKIDLEMFQDFAGAHFAYDQEGTFFDVDAETGMQTSQPATWCAHTRPEGPGSEFPLGVDGNHMSSVFNLTTREVWFVPAWTCHYKEWQMSWHYVDLKPYAQYRKTLQGD